jgi:cell division protein FtsN
MPKDYAKHQAHEQKKEDSHIKLWLLILFLIGLCIVGLIALNHHQTKLKTITVKIPIHHAKPLPDANSTPQFDFYTILPKEKVSVAKLSPPRKSDIQYALQVSSVQNPIDADHLRAELSLLGFDVYIEKTKITDKIWNRVNIGPYFSPQAAKTDQKRLAENNIKSILKKIRLH